MSMNYLRGHEIVFVNGYWRFKDTMKSTVATWKRRLCGCCGKPVTAEGHDACLSTLPGVVNACCGHGNVRDAYVVFDDGRRLYGLAARQWQLEVNDVHKRGV